MTVPQIGKSGYGVFRALALNGPCKCLSDDRLERLFLAIISIRKTRKVSFNVLRDMLEKLSSYGSIVIVAAVDAYLEKQESEGGYSEAYLLGIARGEAKRNGCAPSTPPRPAEPEKDAGPCAGEIYLRSVIGCLRELYRRHGISSDEAKAIVKAGQELYSLADAVKLEQIMAGEVDDKATLIEADFRAAMPGLGRDIPRFSPYAVT